MIWALPETIGLIAATPSMLLSIAVGVRGLQEVLGAGAAAHAAAARCCRARSSARWCRGRRAGRLTWALAPWPSATITMTAATPITMPSVVSMLRPLFARSASRAEGMLWLSAGRRIGGSARPVLERSPSWLASSTAGRAPAGLQADSRRSRSPPMWASDGRALPRPTAAARRRVSMTHVPVSEHDVRVPQTRRCPARG